VYAQGQRIGSLLTALTGRQFMDWQVAYLVGGGMGLVLLVMRLGTFESRLFTDLKARMPSRGDIRLLLLHRERLMRYISCILIGVPIWYVIGVLVNLSQDVFVPALGIDTSRLDADGLRTINGTAIKYAYIGLSVGDLLSALLSQLWRSRRKVILLYLCLNLLLTLYFLFGLRGADITTYNWTCLALGVATGYWVLFVTVSSEQFGTNIRATVATSTPNFVRGSVWPITSAFRFLALPLGSITGALVVGLLCLGAAIWATLRVQETFSRDMDFVEE
jgi:hypothetical protein